MTKLSFAPFFTSVNLIMIPLISLPVFALESYSVKGLPIFKIHLVQKQSGKVTSDEIKKVVGYGELPFSNLEDPSITDVPPSGLIQSKKEQKIEFNNEMIMTTLTLWEYPGNSDRTIRQWTSNKIKNPFFAIPIPMKLSGSLPVLSGSIKFEFSDPANQMEVSGKYHGTTSYRMENKSIIAHRYAYTLKDMRGVFYCEIIVSSEIPHVYCYFKIYNDDAFYESSILSVEFDKPSKDFFSIEQHGFGLEIPKGWKNTTPQLDNEIARFVPFINNNQQPKLITIERIPSDGKDVFTWGSDFCTNNEGKFGGSIDSTFYIGGHKTYEIHRWTGARSLERAALYACKKDQDIYTVIVWVSRLEKRKYADYSFIKDMLNSWRWIKKTK